MPPQGVLVLVSLAWGATFSVTRVGLTAAGPFAFLGVRFAIAALLLVAVSAPILRGLTRRELRAGAIIGACIAVSFACQTVGLKTLGAGESAFLTALYVPLVPIFGWLAFRRAIGPAIGAGIALACAGVACMAGPDGLTVGLGLGEALTVACAAIAAAEIVLIGQLSPGCDARRLAIVQVVVAGALSFVGMGLAGEPLPAASPTFLACAGALGLASAFIQVAMNWAQRSVPAARATLIYTLEPVWAAGFGALLGERMGPWAGLGALLILAGVLASQLPGGRVAPAAPPP